MSRDRASEAEEKGARRAFALLCVAVGLVLLFFAAPRDEEVLVFDGQVVQPDDHCVFLDFDFSDSENRSDSGACEDVADREVRRRGWSPGLLICALIAFGVAVRAAVRPEPPERPWDPR
jgi:hypothetical protein